MEVDWVGDTLQVMDSLAGNTDPAYDVFITCLPYSMYMYGYAEAFPDMKSAHWIEAHMHAIKLHACSERNTLFTRVGGALKYRKGCTI